MTKLDAEITKDKLFVARLEKYIHEQLQEINKSMKELNKYFEEVNYVINKY